VYLSYGEVQEKIIVAFLRNYGFFGQAKNAWALMEALKNGAQKMASD